MNADSKIGFTEVRLGLAPSIISVVCLPKLSRADAADFFLTGHRISADRAARAGLINRSVTPGHLDEEVDSVVELLLRGPRPP